MVVEWLADSEYTNMLSQSLQPLRTFSAKPLASSQIRELCVGHGLYYINKAAPGALDEQPEPQTSTNPRWTLKHSSWKPPSAATGELQHAYLSCRVDNSVKGKALRLVGGEIELHHLVLDDSLPRPTKRPKLTESIADSGQPAQALVTLAQLPNTEAAAIGVDANLPEHNALFDDDNVEAAFDELLHNFDWDLEPAGVAVEHRMVSLGDGMPVEVMGLVVIHVHQRELVCLR